jgi:tetratricopeptide (TPR) repeat protein
VLGQPLQTTVDDVLLHSIALGISAGLGWRLAEGSVDVPGVEALVEAARAVGDVVALYQAVGVAATTLSKVGLNDRAVEFALETLELTRREPTLASFRGVAVGDLAVTYFAAGDMANAEKYIRQGIDIAEELGDLSNVAVNRCNLAELLLDRGDLPHAIEQARLVLQSPNYPPITTAIALGLLAEAQYESGDVDAARSIAPDAAGELRRMAELDVSLASYVDRLNRVLEAVEHT